MILSKHLHELVAFRTPKPAVVSLQLDLGSSQPVKSFAALRRGLLRRTADLSDVEKDLRRIETFLDKELDANAGRGLALYSSKRFGLWRACPLPVPLQDGLSVDARPRLAPLLSLADQHHRFGVLLVDRRRARFLEVFLGQAQEYPEMTVEAEPGSEPPHGYLKRITDKLDGLSRNQGFQRIVIGVEPGLSLALVNRLHSSLQQNLILDADLSPAAAAPEVLARITACEAEARRVRESVLVRRLLDAAKTSRLAVLGLEPTLSALQSGQVRVLFVREGFAKMGRKCPGCGQLSINWPKCLSCRRPTEAVFNVVGEMLQRAYELNCEVYRLFSETPLDNVGRIGAELSHEKTAAPAPVPAPEPVAA